MRTTTAERSEESHPAAGILRSALRAPL